MTWITPPVKLTSCEELGTFQENQLHRTYGRSDRRIRERAAEDVDSLPGNLSVDDLTTRYVGVHGDWSTVLGRIGSGW